MKVVVRKRFIGDASSLHSRDLIDDLIFLLDLCSEVSSAASIPGFKWMTGYPKFARIQFGDYRIGVRIEQDTIIFICLLHREIIYKQFP